jgi:large subunit ribosomal protein L17
MLANLVRSLIKHKRVTTTLAKAKAARPVAEKMVTFGKRGTIHDRRLVEAHLRAPARTLHKTREQRLAWRQDEDVVRILFEDIAPGFSARPGGYTRIVKLAKRRRGDAGEQAILEWVDGDAPAAAEEDAAVEEQTEEKTEETETAKA